ncbi:hypothetical protein J3R30DRAFT_3693942 [Lentinula aciculospora]|uniref:SCD domain-containing protein n=1 Tax=Lentinula aciculospora TaxID=153920 RepID=A0A9W9DY13_9AGAR|nr:hypothetical protein J3R30DRAFT_3693942 [Lentinula aciculospora]
MSQQRLLLCERLSHLSSNPDGARVSRFSGLTMSATPSPAGPRRSQREKKKAKLITTVTEPTATSRKRKHADTDDEGPVEADDSAEEDGDDNDIAQANTEGTDGSEDEDERPKKSLKKNKASAAKRPRITVSATRKAKTSRVPKDPAATKLKKRANKAPDAPFDPKSITKATNISSDNPLFNAILNPNAALQGTVEDFLESLDQDENQALAELVNMILRCCACNDTIDGDTAVDYDGVVDRLDDMAEELKKTTSPAGTYPLISKASPFHIAKPKYSFRASLSEFLARLINSSALLGTLYNSQLIETLQVWLVPMSSSQIRSIRHTSTVIALEVEAALCEVAKEVEKEVELTGRMKEGEKKRARTKGNTANNSELDVKLRETQERQRKLEEFIKEFINGVFIHRYRDLDHVIRTECISSLSTFFETLPSHFCTGSDYLRYVGWVLSDPATSVRLAAVKALQVVYEGAGAGSGSKKKKGSGEAVVIPALRHFTTRFLPRLLEIARFDVDIGIRVAVMNVLGCVDELALLPEEDRSRLGTLVFSDENRVRKAVGRFVGGVWEEWVEEKLGEIEVQPSRLNGANGRRRGQGRGRTGGNKSVSSDVDRDKVGIKGFARLLVRWGHALDRERRNKSSAEEERDEDDDSEDRDTTVGDIDMNIASDTRGIAPTLVVHPGKMTEVVTRGRIGLAVDALWDEMEVVRDWEGILDMLILDHSASGVNDDSEKVINARKRSKMSAIKKRGRYVNDDGEGQAGSGDEDDDDNASTGTRVDQSWRLTEAEEGALLEILVASLRRTKKDDDSAWEPITQALIKALPRLFIKYQTDEIRIVDVLTLPTLMNLEVYLEMRETNAYISLWSDISKQFLTHTSSYAITTAAQTIISHLLVNTALSNINSEQILELEDELAGSLRDAVAGPAPPLSNGESSSQIARDIEICHLTEDEVLTLTSVIFRLRTLAGRRDMSSWMEDNEGGKQSSAWDILCAVSERARLSVGGEGEMLEQSLQLLTLYIMWKSRSLLSIASVNTSAEETQDRENLISQRDSLVEKLIEYAVGTQVQGNGIVECVKRVAFKNLLDLHVLFLSAPNDMADMLPSLTLVMNDEVQWRCAGYVQAEVERYADGVDNSRHDEGSDTEDEQSDDGESEGNDDARGQSKKNKKAYENKTGSKEHDSEVDFASRPLLEQEYVFIDVISTFLRAMRTGVIQVRHGAVLLAHYGRLGPAFDSCAKLVVDVLKDEGLPGDNGQLIVLVVTQAMKEAYNVHKHSNSGDDTNFVALGKLLSSCFILRGGQLTILRRLDAQYLVEIHTTLISWIIKQIGTRPSSNSKDLKSFLPFFRGLVPLVAAMQSRDALKIKAYLDQAWVQVKLEPGATTLWEPLRAYEKRLGTAMGKDKPSVPKARSGKKKKNAGLSTDGEESEVERLIDDDDVPPEPPRPRPRPRRAASARKRAPEPSDSDSDPEPSLRTKGVTSDSPNRFSNPVTIGKRPRADEDEEEPDNEATPRPSHKRSRRESQDKDEGSELQEPDEEAPSMSNGNDHDTLHLAAPPVESREHSAPDVAVPKRKKRIRH